MSIMTYFYESIDRNAIILKPKKPLFDWVNNVFDDMEPIFERDESNIYLIREMGSNQEIERWVQRNFDKLFANELNDWCTDENLWPLNRTYRMFKDWFDVEINSMILDLEDFPVSKE